MAWGKWQVICGAGFRPNRWDCANNMENVACPDVRGQLPSCDPRPDSLHIRAGTAANDSGYLA